MLGDTDAMSIAWQAFAATIAALLLLHIIGKLHGIHALLLPAAAPPTRSAVGTLLRKTALVVYGAVFLLFSSDKVSKKDLRRARADAHGARGVVDREVRIIFVRHGESVWNYVFNRGFGPSFLVRLVRVTLHELYLLPWDDSAYLDSPLSELGIQQCADLQKFLRNPAAGLDPAAEADFAALTAGEGRTLLISSQLRRAVSTIAIALSDRLERSNESVLLHSSCQEISRNFDTMALAPASCAPRLDRATELRAPKASFDGSANKGNKGLRFRGADRLKHFARWAADRPESTIVVAGHSLWFRSFFQVYLAEGAEHVCTKRKLVNCGVVGFTLQVSHDADNEERHRIDPASISVVYGGFASK